jgi:cysteinyl-tRNA synthetase
MSNVILLTLLTWVLASISCLPSQPATPNNQTDQTRIYLPVVTRPPASDWQNVQSWTYQLTDYPNDQLKHIADSNFDLAVVDLARDGTDDYFTRAEITHVQNSGKLVLAYFEIGAIEKYRPEWSSVPQALKLGAVDGWPNEQYVKYWDSRWWPIVKGRIDQAINAGFDGAYLDMVVTYDEIPANATGTNRDDLAQKMVDLIARTSAYAKSIDPDFKIVPQNSPELYAWPDYLPAIDGLGMEELFYLATDAPCSYDWCVENRDDAAAILAAGKLVLTVDYANKSSHIDDASIRSLELGFVPYVTDVELNAMRVNPGWEP